MPLSSTINSLLLSIAKNFCLPDKIIAITPYGHGLINDTYFIETASACFIMQRINPAVFPRPEQVMENLATIINHVRQKNASQVKLKIPGIILTTEQKPIYQDNQSCYWRIISFIENTVNYKKIHSSNDAIQTGFALGHFHLLLNDLSPSKLYDTLPGFHITTSYLSQYQLSLSTHKPNLKTREYSDFIEKHRHYAAILETAKSQGILHLRVTHGDPKLDNILFDDSSGRAVSLIDLDTVKPGLIHYDIGDCLRSCCNTESSNSSDAHFDVDICELILKNYFAEADSFLTLNDYKYIYDAILLIPFELGLRFFTDYLDGNKYFKATFPEQNLTRAHQQFQLMKSIDGQQNTIKQLLKSLEKTVRPN